MNQFTGEESITLEPQTYKSGCFKNLAIEVLLKILLHPHTGNGGWKVSIMDSRNRMLSSPTGIQTDVCSCTRHSRSPTMYTVHSPQFLKSPCIKSTSFERLLEEDLVVNRTRSHTKCALQSFRERQGALFESILLGKKFTGSIGAGIQATSKSR